MRDEGEDWGNLSKRARLTAGETTGDCQMLSKEREREGGRTGVVVHDVCN